MDYKKISQEILRNIGGRENIENAAHCVTRLRLVLKDTSKFNKEELLKVEGTKGVFLNSGQLQIIFGSGVVNEVFDAFTKEAGIKEASLNDIKSAGMKKENLMKQGFKVFSDIFIPIVPAFVGAAMILGVKSVLTTAGLFGMDGALADKYEVIAGFATFLTVVASTFAFLPLLVTYSAVKRFGGNPIFGIVLGCTMLYPTLMDANVFALGKEVPQYWNLLGFSIPAVGFQGGVFPAILSSWFLARAEKFYLKIVPQMVSFIFVPALTLVSSGLALFLVFGPIGNALGTGLGTIIDFLYSSCGPFGAFIFAGALQPLVVTGTQHAIQGIEASLVAQTGFNYIQPLWSVSIIAQGGGAIGMYILAKKKSKDREIAMSSFIPTLFGISEPAIFAVNLKDSSIPFLCSILGAGLAGAYMKIFDVKAIGFALTGLPGITISNPPTLIHYIIGNFLAFSLPIIFIVSYNKMKKIK
ncbi:PTS transporter subunit EIIC [Fusobacterium sp.]|uniref:PTS transporter subunit EIIC n=1 Tax=Fusobacterium sp. TaxID=68766 RepID=UPI002902A118|nr:PTS transporter subunit EIIC [Fusobacterium sp.]MDU1910374.1 PTS transporter subunit EIIC [Fusobacterium sp.]